MSLIFPKPKVMKKEQDLCYSLVNGFRTQTKILKSWNIEQSRLIKAFPDDNVYYFERIMKDYCRELETLVKDLDDLKALQGKVFSHIELFRMCLTQSKLPRLRDVYLDSMEHIMKIICNLELQVVKTQIIPLYINQECKRGYKKDLARLCAETIIHDLSIFLLGDEICIEHVLMQLEDIEKSSLIKAICNHLFYYFLVINTPKESSVEAYCRHHILFCKWKEITKEDKQERLRIYEQNFVLTKDQLSSRLWREISGPTEQTLAEKIMEKFCPASIKCKAYFNYLKSIDETPIKVEDEDPDLSVCTTYEGIKESDCNPKQNSSQESECVDDSVIDLCNDDDDEDSNAVINLCDDEDEDDDVKLESVQYSANVCLIEDNEIDHLHDDDDLQRDYTLRLIKETITLKSFNFATTRRYKNSASKRNTNFYGVIDLDTEPSSPESFLDSINIFPRRYTRSNDTTKRTPSFLDSLHDPKPSKRLKSKNHQNVFSNEVRKSPDPVISSNLVETVSPENRNPSEALASLEILQSKTQPTNFSDQPIRECEIIASPESSQHPSFLTKELHTDTESYNHTSRMNMKNLNDFSFLHTPPSENRSCKKQPLHNISEPLAATYIPSPSISNHSETDNLIQHNSTLNSSQKENTIEENTSNETHPSTNHDENTEFSDREYSGCTQEEEQIRKKSNVEEEINSEQSVTSSDEYEVIRSQTPPENIQNKTKPCFVHLNRISGNELSQLLHKNTRYKSTKHKENEKKLKVNKGLCIDKEEACSVRSKEASKRSNSKSVNSSESSSKTINNDHFRKSVAESNNTLKKHVRFPDEMEMTSERGCRQKIPRHIGHTNEERNKLHDRILKPKQKEFIKIQYEKHSTPGSTGICEYDTVYIHGNEQKTLPLKSNSNKRIALISESVLTHGIPDGLYNSNTDAAGSSNGAKKNSSNSDTHESNRSTVERKPEGYEKNRKNVSECINGHGNFNANCLKRTKRLSRNESKRLANNSTDISEVAEAPVDGFISTSDSSFHPAADAHSISKWDSILPNGVETFQTSTPSSLTCHDIDNTSDEENKSSNSNRYKTSEDTSKNFSEHLKKHDDNHTTNICNYGVERGQNPKAKQRKPINNPMDISKPSGEYQYGQPAEDSHSISYSPPRGASPTADPTSTGDTILENIPRNLPRCHKYNENKYIPYHRAEKRSIKKRHKRHFNNPMQIPQSNEKYQHIQSAEICTLKSNSETTLNDVGNSSNEEYNSDSNRLETDGETIDILNGSVKRQSKKAKHKRRCNKPKEMTKSNEEHLHQSTDAHNSIPNSPLRGTSIDIDPISEQNLLNDICHTSMPVNLVSCDDGNISKEENNSFISNRHKTFKSNNTTSVDSSRNFAKCHKNTDGINSRLHSKIKKIGKSKHKKLSNSTIKRSESKDNYQHSQPVETIDPASNSPFQSDNPSTDDYSMSKSVPASTSSLGTSHTSSRNNPSNIESSGQPIEGFHLVSSSFHLAADDHSISKSDSTFAKNRETFQTSTPSNSTCHGVDNTSDEENKYSNSNRYKASEDTSQNFSEPFKKHYDNHTTNICNDEVERGQNPEEKHRKPINNPMEILKFNGEYRYNQPAKESHPISYSPPRRASPTADPTSTSDTILENISRNLPRCHKYNGNENIPNHRAERRSIKKKRKRHFNDTVQIPQSNEKYQHTPSVEICNLKFNSKTNPNDVEYSSNEEYNSSNSNRLKTDGETIDILNGTVKRRSKKAKHKRHCNKPKEMTKSNEEYQHQLTEASNSLHNSPLRETSIDMDPISEQNLPNKTSSTPVNLISRDNENISEEENNYSISNRHKIFKPNITTPVDSLGSFSKSHKNTDGSYTNSRLRSKTKKIRKVEHKRLSYSTIKRSEPNDNCKHSQPVEASDPTSNSLFQSDNPFADDYSMPNSEPTTTLILGTPHTSFHINPSNIESSGQPIEGFHLISSSFHLAADDHSIPKSDTTFPKGLVTFQTSTPSNLTLDDENKSSNSSGYKTPEDTFKNFSETLKKHDHNHTTNICNDKVERVRNPKEKHRKPINNPMDIPKSNGEYQYNQPAEDSHPIPYSPPRWASRTAVDHFILKPDPTLTNELETSHISHNAAISSNDENKPRGINESNEQYQHTQPVKALHSRPNSPLQGTCQITDDYSTPTHADLETSFRHQKNDNDECTSSILNDRVETQSRKEIWKRPFNKRIEILKSNEYQYIQSAEAFNPILESRLQETCSAIDIDSISEQNITNDLETSVEAIDPASNSPFQSDNPSADNYSMPKSEPTSTSDLGTSHSSSQINPSNIESSGQPVEGFNPISSSFQLAADDHLIPKWYSTCLGTFQTSTLTNFTHDDFGNFSDDEKKSSDSNRYKIKQNLTDDSATSQTSTPINLISREDGKTSKEENESSLSNRHKSYKATPVNRTENNIFSNPKELSEFNGEYPSNQLVGSGIAVYFGNFLAVDSDTSECNTDTNGLEEESTTENKRHTNKPIETCYKNSEDSYINRIPEVVEQQCGKEERSFIEMPQSSQLNHSQEFFQHGQHDQIIHDCPSDQDNLIPKEYANLQSYILKLQIPDNVPSIGSVRDEINESNSSTYDIGERQSMTEEYKLPVNNILMSETCGQYQNNYPAGHVYLVQEVNPGADDCTDNPNSSTHETINNIHKILEGINSKRRKNNDGSYIDRITINPEERQRRSRKTSSTSQDYFQSLLDYYCHVYNSSNSLDSSSPNYTDENHYYEPTQIFDHDVHTTDNSYNSMNSLTSDKLNGAHLDTYTDLELYTVPTVHPKTSRLPDNVSDSTRSAYSNPVVQNTSKLVRSGSKLDHIADNNRPIKKRSTHRNLNPDLQESNSEQFLQSPHNISKKTKTHAERKQYDSVSSF